MIVKPKPSPQTTILIVLFLTALGAVWVPIFHVVFHGPLRSWAILYFVAWPLLFIAALGGLQVASVRTVSRSRQQKIVFFGAIPLLALVLWLGVITGHKLLCAVVWYLGNLVVSAYFFLGPNPAKGQHE